jgi:hypothetical protein
LMYELESKIREATLDKPAAAEAVKVEE